MSTPHVCRCEKCGAEGTIVPAVTTYESPYASSRADQLQEGFGKTPTCTHGYSICNVCKFPPAIQQVSV